MPGQVQSGPMLLPGDARYDGLAKEFNSPEFAAMVAGTLEKGYRFHHLHPIANLFPMLPEPRRAEFRSSLAEGQHHAITLHRGMVLDGRNRARELCELKKPISTGVFIGTDLQALDFVIAENLARRHLTESQRAMLASDLGALKLGANQHTRASQGAQICAPTLFNDADTAPAAAATEAGAALSQTERAERMSVSRRSVQSADKVKESGAPELAEAVRSGQIKIAAAVEIASLPIEQQRAIIASADPKVVKEVSKKNRTDKTKRNRQEWLRSQAAPDAAPLLTGRKASVLYIDIPRKFKVYSDETGTEKSPENHYRTEDFEFLAGLRDKIQELAKPDCVLFMWAWASSLLDQLDLMAEWGFSAMRPRDEAGRLLRGPDGRILPPAGEGRYRSHMIWAKRSANGNYHRGTGFWFIDCHELLLVGARGTVKAPIMGTQSLSIFDAQIGEHSEKPVGIRRLIDLYFEGLPKTELFARVDDVDAFKMDFPTWEVWGNEAAATPAGVVGTATGASACSSPARATAEPAE